MISIVSIGLREAFPLAELTMNFALDDGLDPVAICVVDASAQQICAVRLNGVKSPSVRTAHDKAVTAVLYSRDTADFRWRVDQETGLWTPADEAG